MLTAGGAVWHRRIAGIKRQHAGPPMAVNVLIARTMLLPIGKLVTTGKTYVPVTIGVVLQQWIAEVRSIRAAEIGGAAMMRI